MQILSQGFELVVGLLGGLVVLVVVAMIFVRPPGTLRVDSQDDRRR